MTEVLVVPNSALLFQRYHPRTITISGIASNETRDSKLPTNNGLPNDFQPGPFDVICSQGRKGKKHPGNAHFQSLIQGRAEEYAKAVGKSEKSKIVQSIIKAVHTKSPKGGFVKKIQIQGRTFWEIVSLDQIREKVSQTLRNTLEGHYRSSSSAKKRSRKESNLKRIVDFEEIVASNRFVSARMCELSNTLQKRNNSREYSLSDSKLLRLMTRTNTAILRELKEDTMVQGTIDSKVPSSPEPEPDRDSAHSQQNVTVDETLKRFALDDNYVLLRESNAKKRKML